MSKSLPIIFLTARDSDFDTVSGLRLGADDFVPYPLPEGALHDAIERIRATPEPAPAPAAPAAVADEGEAAAQRTPSFKPTGDREAATSRTR